MPRSATLFHPLDRSPLYGIQSRRRLAQLFGLHRASLDEVLALDRPFSHREMVEERKGKMKARTIQEPRGRLRPIHDKMRQLLSQIEPPEFLYCPVKGRSAVQNAAQHLGAKEIWTLDVRDYFPSTPSHRVFWFFHTVMRCSPDVASILAKLLTVEGHLATGSTVSPILSFYAFFDMWHSINDAVRAANCSFTVYMDDITLSGDRITPAVKWEVKRRLHARGLEFHKEKRSRGGILEVTGVVHRAGGLTVPNRQLRKAHELRQQLAATTNMKEAAILHGRLTGLRSNRMQVNKALLRQ